MFLLLISFLAGCTPPGPRAILKGKKLLDDGRYAEAATQFQEGATVIGTNALAWYYLGLANQYCTQTVNAVQAYQRALSLDPDLLEARFNLGCLWIEQNRPDYAKAELTSYVLRQPHSAHGWEKLGEAQYLAHDLATAERSFDEARQLDPSNAPALNGLGLVRLQRNRGREAAQWFNAALKQQPDFAPALLNLAIVSQVQLNDIPFAISKYREYLALKPPPANSAEVKAVMEQLTRELNASSAASPQQPVASSPPPQSNPQPVHPAPQLESKPETTASPPAKNFATTTPRQPVQSSTTESKAPQTEQSRVQKQTPEPNPKPTQELAKNSIEQRPSLLHQLNPANLFRSESGNETSAAASASVEPGRYAYHQLAKPEPGDRGAAQRVFAEGVREHRQNHFSRAFRLYEQAVQLDPSYYDAYYDMGLAASSMSDLHQALTAYECALAIQPDSTDARYNFALTLENAGYTTDAMNEFQKLLNQEPTDARAHLAMGNIYAQHLHDPARARAEYEQVLKYDPSNSQSAAIQYWLKDHPR